MTPITLDQVQQDLLHQLPDAMRRALESYTAFVTQPVDHDPKNYAAHHAGGKAALSHLEALLKLSKNGSSPNNNPPARIKRPTPCNR